MMRMMRDMMGSADGDIRMIPFEYVEGRIAFFETELGITEAQFPQLGTFADARRDSYAAVTPAWFPRLGGPPSPGRPTTDVP